MPAILLFLLSGCDLLGMGNDCSQDVTSVGMNENSPAGFTGTEILDLVAAEFTGRITYMSGASAGVTLSLSGGQGDCAWTEQEANNEKADCPDYLGIPATFTFWTDDGDFDETKVGEAQATEPTSASFQADFLVETMHGDYEVLVPDSSYDPEKFPMTVWIEATFGEFETSGIVYQTSAQYSDPIDVGSFEGAHY